MNRADLYVWTRWGLLGLLMASCNTLNGGEEYPFSKLSPKSMERIGLRSQHSRGERMFASQGAHEFEESLAYAVRFRSVPALTEGDLRSLEQRVFELTNAQRMAQRRECLLWDEALARAARSHSENMATRNFFAHKDPRRGNLDKRLGRFGIRWKVCAENIWSLRGTGSESHHYLASKAVSDWMNSPGHRANILNKSFTHTGVGAYYDLQDNAYFLTQIFTRPDTN